MTAEDYYISTVDPSIRPTCASCHATGTDGAPVYLASTAQPSYTTITSGSVPGLLAAPANSQLLLHGAHTGPALLPGQVTIVTQWLNMEVAARGINPAPVETVQQALAEFGQCMSYSDFTDNSATGVSAADISKQQTVRDGPCQGCHNAGDGGFWASSGTINGTDEVQVMFQNSQQLPYIKKWVTGLVDANGNFTTLAPSNEIEDNSAIAAECTGPACHPKFQLSSQAQQAIDTFVMTTITKWQNKQCTTTATDAGADSAP
jgi:cytochrome c5